MSIQYQHKEGYERKTTLQEKNIIGKLADIMAMEHLITPDEKMILQELIQRDEEL